MDACDWNLFVFTVERAKQKNETMIRVVNMGNAPLNRLTRMMAYIRKRLEVKDVYWKPVESGAIELLWSS